eukprot:COSAG01_NODE_2885_length_6901_cov_101.837028_10_plen_65_part_00
MQKVGKVPKKKKTANGQRRGRKKKPDETLQLLGSLYDPEQTQREFMMKALEADDDLTPSDVMKF